MLVLHHAWRSSASRRVRLCLEEEIAPDQVTPSAHPRVAEWWTAIRARPAFARANIGPFTDP